MTTRTTLPKSRLVRLSSLISIAAMLIFAIALLTIMRQRSSFGAFDQPFLVVQATSGPTAAPTVTSVPDLTATARAIPMFGLPIAVLPAVATTFADAATKFAYTTSLRLGTIMTGQVTTANPQSYYTLTVIQDGLLEITVTSSDFKPHVRFYQLDADPITMSDGRMTASDTTTIYLNAHTDERIGISVSGDTSTDLGTFTVRTNLRQPIVFDESKPFDEQFITSQGGVNPNAQYYSFDAKAGDILDVNVKSDGRSDLNVYLQGYSHQGANLPLFFTALEQQCVDTVFWQQCYNAASVSHPNPGLHGVFVTADRHYEMVVSSANAFNNLSDYSVRLTRNKPYNLSPGGMYFPVLSAKLPIVPVIIDANQGETVSLDFKRLNTPNAKIQITAIQNEQVLTGRFINPDEIDTPFTVTSMSLDPILLTIHYFQPADESTPNLFSLERK